MSRPYCIFAAYLTLSSIVVCCNATAQEPKPANKKADEEVVTQTVIAEGSGSSEDEALKSAFRVAVQQVVGAVVSVETLVKDDAIIEDKILTYSDGFIEKYDELPGSKTVKAGIHRIKVKALVQRKNLVAKLKASNVAMFAVDGSSIFAEAVSKLQSEKDATALIEAAFEGFPESCIKASVVGKPKTIDKTDEGATLVVTVVMEPDLVAFKAFQVRLTDVLEKMANQPDNFSAKFKPREPYFKEVDRSIQLFEGVEDERLWRRTIAAPDKKGKPKSKFFIAIATSQTKAFDRMNFRYFPVDETLQPVFEKIASKRPKSQLQLLGTEGVIASEGFLANSNLDNHRWGDLWINPSAMFAYGRSDDTNRICLITPAFQQRSLFQGFGGVSALILSNKVSIDLKVKLSFEEIKSISEAKVQINFENSPVR